MTVRFPATSVNILPAQEQIANEEQRVLIVGIAPAYTGTFGEVIQDFPNDKSEDSLFGENSQLAWSIRAFKSLNKNTRLDVLPLAAGAGATASCDITVTGTAAENGTFTFKLSNFIDEIDVNVLSADNNDTTAAAIAAALDAIPNFSAAAVANVITLTYDTAGAEFNELALQIKGLVDGQTVAVSADWSGGTGVPAGLTTVFDAVGDQRYQTVVWPFSSSIDDLTDFLDPRFNVDNDILDGVGIIGKVDTKANLETLANAENSESLVIIGQKLITAADQTGSAFTEAPFADASYFAAIRSKRLTDDTNIADLVITPTGGRDQFGGSALATLPYANSPLNAYDIAKIGRTFSKIELDQLEDAGVSSYSNNPANNTVILGEIVTTRKTDEAGNPEETFHFLNSVDAASVAREQFSNNLRARFRQSRLTEGTLQAGRAMANKQTVEAELDRIYDVLSGADFVIVESGNAAQRFFKENRNVVIDKSTGTVSIDMTVPIVTQLRVIQANLFIAFSTN